MAERLVAIVDSSKHRFREVVQKLQEAEIQVEQLDDIKKVMPLMETRSPEILLINLIVQGGSSLSVIREVSQKMGHKTRIVVITSMTSKENIMGSIKAGAIDFISDPFETSFFLDRIKYHLQEKMSVATDQIQDRNQQEAAVSFQMIYECLRVITESAESHLALFECIRKMAALAKSPRINIIVGDIEKGVGHVLASSDDPTFKGRKVDLEKYPEVREVLLNSNIVYISDITANPLTKDIKETVKTIQINSLMIFPIRHRQECIGALCLRMDANSVADIKEKHLKTFFTVALAIAPKVAAQKLIISKQV